MSIPRDLAAADGAFGFGLPVPSLSPMTRELIAAARPLIRQPADDRDTMAFLSIYRDWILEHLNLKEERELWAERHAALLHLMAGAPTLGEALETRSRFSAVVWGDAMRLVFERQADGSGRLTIEDRHEDSLEGTISALWLMSTIFVQLEFLAGHRLEYLEGCLPQSRPLPAELQQIFYGGKVTYVAPGIAMHMPESVLDLPVTVTLSDIPGFLDSLMARAISASRSYPAYRMVYNLIWQNLTRHPGAANDLKALSRQLGSSPATLRRQLRGEGYTFKAIKADILDRVAKMWLSDATLSVEEIADRLGYSNTFAFRRAFRQTNAMAPSTFRKQV